MRSTSSISQRFSYWKRLKNRCLYSLTQYITVLTRIINRRAVLPLAVTSSVSHGSAIAKTGSFRYVTVRQSYLGMVDEIYSTIAYGAPLCMRV